MIKLIIFDLDGVLIDSKMDHFESLNKALEKIDKKFTISFEEHLKHFDGLPTKKKLEKLTIERDLPKEYHQRVWQDKQEITFEIIKKNTKESSKLIDLFETLSKMGIKIYVASNSIRKSLKLYLLKLGLIEYIDGYISNEDVQHSKPNCEMYLKAMYETKCQPKETIIVEDSHVGILAATASGSNIIKVRNSNDVTKDLIINKLNEFNNMSNKISNTCKWKDDKLNILIPMAGEGSRFANAGYSFPKPLIDVNGKPMIQTVVENLNIEANYIYIVRTSHFEKYNLNYLLNLITPNCKIVKTDKLTEGACCTTLLAEEFIDNDNSLLIANSDQFVEWDSCEFLYSATTGNSDGTILTFESTHPKWSFVKLNEEGYITEVAEKKVISNIATVGIYFWKRGKDYVKYSKEMIEKNIRVNNEFYVAPVYNEAIRDSKLIKPHNIQKLWGLGTPEDLNYFLNNYEKV